MSTLTADESMLDISMMSAEYGDRDFTDAMVDLANKNIPMEIITRLEGLWRKTKKIAGETINIGKILVSKIIEFILKHPNMAIGIALGAAIGALTGLIPFIGPLIQPIAIGIGIAFGGLTGASMDIESDSIMESAIHLAKEFFNLLADLFNGIADYWTAS